MLFLLSPAKSLDYETPITNTERHTAPLFVAQSSQLIERLKQKSPAQIASLMRISDPLAGLNVARYQAWSRLANPHNARQAIFAFNGDVYAGIQAHSLSTEDLEWAQNHLAILSGLYGVLRPLDLMQPYRLEMGTHLATNLGNNLYQFWGTQIAEYLSQHSATSSHTQPVVVNLASQEYFKSVDRTALKVPVIACVFQDWKIDRYKIISFHAKRARGLMARFAITERAQTPQDLQAFNAEGYTYEAAASDTQTLVFRRRL